MKNALHILHFLLAAAARGEQTALITITDVSGTSPRAPGAHMAVSATGAYSGSLSGGCVEAAIIGEAKRVIQTGKPETLRIGENSPFIDLQLPCGGGIDILVLPAPDIAALNQAANWLTARQPVMLLLSQADGLTAQLARPDDTTGWRSKRFLARHEPDMRLLIAGHGAETLSLARLGHCYGAEIFVLSPDQALVDTVIRLGAGAKILPSRQHAPKLSIDPHTATVLLFHDHDWEDAILAEALAQPGFYVGAMGSRATQARRLHRLAQRGVPKNLRARIVSPIGFITPARDPDTLAISALAQIVSLHAASAGQTSSAPALKRA
jgi:xanthine dehydrogenase accessory factor